MRRSHTARSGLSSRDILRLLVAIALAAGSATVALRAPVAHAAAITVTTTVDENNADGDCSLREALIAANGDIATDACPAGSGADTIILPAGTYTLTLPGSGTTVGDLDITDDLTLVGDGPATTTIDANGIGRVFAIYLGSIVSISNVTLTGGDSGVAAGSGIWLRDSALTLTRVRVSNNIPWGGIYVLGTASLTLFESRVQQNTGTGVWANAGTTATILSSTISGNTGADTGGGLRNDGGTLTVENSTISGNSVISYAGGIASAGATSLYNATISNNTADSDVNGGGDGGGIYVYGGGTLTARNSIIGGNVDSSPVSPDPDCSGTLTSQGYNLIENTAGCVITGSAIGNLTGVSPNLGPLQNNGGATQTHALQANSPAVDAGNPLGCADQNSVDLTLDQRGFLRTGRCDMGAYEYNSSGAPTPSNTPTRPPSSTRTAPATATATRTPTSTQTPGNVLTATAQASPTRTPTRTGTAGPSPTRPPVDGATATASATASATATATRTGTAGPSPTRPPADGPSPTTTGTATAQASITPSATRTPGEGPEPDASPTATATGTAANPYEIYLPGVYK